MKILLIIAISITLDAHSQPAAVRVGGLCPDVELQHIVHYKTTSARVSSFRGKLLVLDFWATWCAPCLSLLRVADSLEKKFGDKIQILPVTEQDAARVSAFLTNMSRVRHIHPPSVTGDTLLRALFPHTEIPHLVWIDAGGKVVAITGAEALTAQNIQRTLDGSASMALKQDVVKTIDERRPMFVTGNEIINDGASRFEKVPDSDVLFHSVMTRYIEGFGCESGGGTGKLTCKNNSIGGLYRFAAGHDKLEMLLLNRTVWEVTNPSLQEFSDTAALAADGPQAREWLRRYSFCYELQFPPAMESRKYDIMLDELNRYFGAAYHIEGHLEKRKVKCLALVQSGYAGLLASRGIDENYISNEYHLKLSNRPVRALINFLSIRLDAYPPLVDETGYAGTIDIDLNCDLSDLRAVNQALGKYGLQLEEKETEREMIVIKDSVNN